MLYRQVKYVQQLSLPTLTFYWTFHWEFQYYTGTTVYKRQRHLYTVTALLKYCMQSSEYFNCILCKLHENGKFGLQKWPINVYCMHRTNCSSASWVWSTEYTFQFSDMAHILVKEYKTIFPLLDFPLKNIILYKYLSKLDRPPIISFSCFRIKHLHEK